jgi:hypothetical protein
MSSVAHTQAVAPDAPKYKGRVAALDFTKGVLVLLMVFYHWMNYFVSVDGGVYKYLRFLTPSFIFLTGFLAANVYLPRYAPAGDHRIPRRLMTRALKLFGIFAILNTALFQLMPGPAATTMQDWPIDDILGAYILGTAGRASAFSVLLPIGYLLVVSAVLLPVWRRFRSVFHMATIALIAGAFALDAAGVTSGYLELLSMGLLGISMGHLRLETVDAAVRRRMAVVFAYAVYLAVLTLWYEVYVLQLAGVCLSVAVIYMLGKRSGAGGAFDRASILLGQYSLFAYLVQIAILQVLHKVLRFAPFRPAIQAATLATGLGLTLFSVYALRRARARVKFVDSTYAAIFG